jgi:hypothetical protein
MRNTGAGGQASCNGFGQHLAATAWPDEMAGQRAAKATQKE